MFVTIRMPDLAGLDETTARRMVANAGLTLDVEYAYSDLAEGYVCDQTPKANEEVGRGSAVTATISRGSGLLLVPRLTGMTQTDAENVLIAQGLSLDVYKRQDGVIFAVGEVTDSACAAVSGSPARRENLASVCGASG